MHRFNNSVVPANTFIETMDDDITIYLINEECSNVNTRAYDSDLNTHKMKQKQKKKQKKNNEIDNEWILFTRFRYNFHFYLLWLSHLMLKQWILLNKSGTPSIGTIWVYKNSKIYMFYTHRNWLTERLIMLLDSRDTECNRKGLSLMVDNHLRIDNWSSDSLERTQCFIQQFNGCTSVVLDISLQVTSVT